MICVLCLTASKGGVTDGHVQGCLQLIHSFYLGNSEPAKGLSLWLAKERAGEMQLHPAKPKLS